MGENSKSPKPPVRGKRGRPSNPQVTKNEKELLKLWHEGVRSQTAVAQILHLNKNTVSKYFTKFSAEVLEHDKEDIFEKEILAKDEALTTLDKVLYDLVYYQNKLEKELSDFDAIALARHQAGQTIYKQQQYFGYNTLKDILRLKSEITEKKHKIQTMPTIDKVIEQEIAAMMQQGQNATSGT